MLLAYGLPSLNLPLNDLVGYVAFAVSSGNMDRLKLLLENGADPEAAWRMDYSSLAWAISEKQPVEMLNLLVKHGADTRRKGLLAVAAEANNAHRFSWLMKKDKLWYKTDSKVPVRDPFSIALANIISSTSV